MYLPPLAFVQNPLTGFLSISRSQVALRLSKLVMPRALKEGRNPRILDMCCGVGISTRALQDAFPDSEFVVGVDTSSEMINVASFLTNHVAFLRPVLRFIRKRIKSDGSKAEFPRKAKYMICNAEQTNFPSKSFDLVTVMYAFHEAPQSGRERILREAHRVLQPGGTLAVVDISTEYMPSPTMLSGEPYGKFGMSYIWTICAFLFFFIDTHDSNYSSLFDLQLSSTRRTSTAKCVRSEVSPVSPTKRLSRATLACGL